MPTKSSSAILDFRFLHSGSVLGASTTVRRTQLLHRIRLARSCADDWFRRNQRRTLGNQVPEKAPIAWSELGLFSGDEELSEPLSFQIERTEPKKDGSFLVYVRFSGGSPADKPWTWEVAARVVKENDHLAIDDVIYLKANKIHTEYRLSEVLAEGCDGPRWVGQAQRQEVK